MGTESYIMALDQGTTSSRCIIFDRSGRICSMAQKEFRQYYPKPGWVEHDPKEIWSSQISVAKEALEASEISAGDIKAIGITNQRETTIVWDRETGEPVYNAVVWQCRRTADIINKMTEDGWEEKIKDRTGLVPDAYFSSSKIAWILNNVERARERAERGELAFGTVDSWLMWNLTKGKVHATDYTNASRTMLFDIHKLEWDREIMDYLKIPESMLPEVKPSGFMYGYTDADILGVSIPIAGAAGDQQAALFGQCCFNPGDVKNTYGTGSFILMNTGTEAVKSGHGLLTTIAAGCRQDKAEYALEGSVFVAGASVQWLRDSMHLIDSASESQKAAESVDDTSGVYIVPSFTGLGAPYWNQDARGVVTGLTRGCTKEHFIRATLESIAYQTGDVIRAMEEDAGEKLKVLKVDGGASANDFLMQFQADIVGTKVCRPECIETTALGAAYLAGLTIGYWKDKNEILSQRISEQTFEPVMAADKRNELLKGWKKAIKCALVWAEE